MQYTVLNSIFSINSKTKDRIIKSFFSGLIFGFIISTPAMVLAQSNSDEDDRILDFLPAIIAGAVSNRTVSSPNPQPPSPPPSGSGNFRIVQFDVIDRLNGNVLLSENVLTWNSAGNVTQNRITAFSLPGSNPSSVLQTTLLNRVFNSINNPLSESYSTTIINGNQIFTGEKTYFYSGTRLRETSNVRNNDNGPDPVVQTNYQYNGNGRLQSATITIITNNIVNTSEQHTLAYNSDNRVSTHQVVSTSAAVTENTSYTHQYDAAGNLRETVRLDNSLEWTRTYNLLSGNQQTTHSILRDRSTGNIISNHDFISTYAVGNCNPLNVNSAQSIENTINGQPFSPNIGCIDR